MPVSRVEGADLENNMVGKSKKRFIKQTLGGTLTMDGDEPDVLVLDPGGAGRTVLLPTEANAANRMFFIINAADAAEALTVKDDSNTTTVVSVGQSEMGIVFCDGTSWHGYSAVA